ncbi:MAG: NifB/NifX family molybdenum-iron cluster-binding protein [Clostridia bacterium]|nr:NifB/NifX family molybdenum-iron cluster-binding protein [Clostridia bacterium]
MRVAVAYLDGDIFSGFGNSEYFKIYDIADGEVVSSEIVSTPDGHSAKVEYLSSISVEVLICSSIGTSAMFMLEDEDIEVYSGVEGSADEAVARLLDGTLKHVNTHHHGEHCDCGCHDHHHDHEEHCDCGCHDHHHDHEEHCDCGCHDHHHDHEEHCDCGCHDHHHDHEEHCDCGCHDHHHDHEEHCDCGWHHH